jgi:DNA-binding LacI/PurR family transcriptional regulator
MATLGMELLLDLLAGKEPAAERIVVAPELVVRDSTAPPPM